MLYVYVCFYVPRYPSHTAVKYKKPTTMSIHLPAPSVTLFTFSSVDTGTYRRSVSGSGMVMQERTERQWLEFIGNLRTITDASWCVLVIGCPEWTLGRISYFRDTVESPRVVISRRDDPRYLCCQLASFFTVLYREDLTTVPLQPYCRQYSSGLFVSNELDPIHADCLWGSSPYSPSYTPLSNITYI